jgi:aryl-alcohol dehydrogenase-like predicted oxidoreductase
MGKLALGTVQFGINYGVANRSGQIKFSVAKDIVRLAKKKKIDLIDTAIAYGESEKVLGKIGIADFKIISKLPDVPINCSNIESWINNEIENCLKRLQTKSIYGLLLHQTKNFSGNSGKVIINTLNKLKSQKLVKKIGVSIYDPSELDILIDRMEINIVQAPLNIIDRRLEASGWLSKLHKNGIEVHTRSTFLQGLLLMPRSKIPSKFDQWSNIWDSWTKELKKNNLDAASVCLSYPLSLPEVNRVIIGVDNLYQFKSLILASNANLKKKDWSFMKSFNLKLIEPSNWKVL